MTCLRVALLTAFVALMAAAPAAASERSDARRFAAAMEPRIELTPEEREALVAGVEARAAHVATTCLPSVKAAATQRERARTLAVVYGFHTYAGIVATIARWLAEGDARLAAIHTSSKTLRRARAGRADLTRFFVALGAAAPADFCAAVTAWEADGFKGDPPGTDAIFAAIEDLEPYSHLRLARGTRLLRRHGATRAQRRAFSGTPRFPPLRDPAADPVEEALNMGPGREAPDDGPTRRPWGRG
jgi:hypothetical protein